MIHWDLHPLNAFLEDTCVLVTLAYLLSRGRLLPTLFDRQRRRWDHWALAALFGLAGASDVLFPGDRHPYVLPTLAVSLAAYDGGPVLGFTAAGLTLILSLPRLPAFPPSTEAIAYSLSVLTAAGVGVVMARLLNPTPANVPQSPGRALLGAFLTGAAAEVLHGVFQTALRTQTAFPIASVLADGFGALLLTLIFSDAHGRRENAKRLLRNEREMAAARLSQLNQLQARLHPHFLFNALAAIAGLCVINPTQAERAVTTLASLLRRFLRESAEDCVPLREEMALVRAYLEIEQLRLGADRLQIIDDVPDSALACPVPRFCLQIPVENAVQHGIAPAGRFCRLRLVARLRARHLVLAVEDDGLGASSRTFSTQLPGETLVEISPHGLTLLWLRLRLSQGPCAQMRLRRRFNQGTLFVLRLPLEDSYAHH